MAAAAIGLTDDFQIAYKVFQGNTKMAWGGGSTQAHTLKRVGTPI